MNTTETLKQKLFELNQQYPTLRKIDQAIRLGISEAELLSLSVGEGVTILDAKFEDNQSGIKDLLLSLKPWGKIMTLTRNENCIHERKGIYENVQIYKGSHNMGVAVNPDIDLRYFFEYWHYAMAVIMETSNTKLYSFQFFNKYGEAVHKIFSTPDSDNNYYSVLVEKFKSEKQGHFVPEKKPLPVKNIELLEEEIDIEAFQKSWREMKDTHDFFGMLKSYKVTRRQALRLAPEGFTKKLAEKSYIRVLELVAENRVSVMCFVHSSGCVQIHSGQIKNIRIMEDWFNILDPMFNLHLKMNSVDEVWLVRKMTDDGIVTSIELFDVDGELIVYFFGERKPGIPELETWRNVINQVEEEEFNSVK